MRIRPPESAASARNRDSHLSLPASGTQQLAPCFAACFGAAAALATQQRAFGDTAVWPNDLPQCFFHDDVEFRVLSAEPRKGCPHGGMVSNPASIRAVKPLQCRQRRFRAPSSPLRVSPLWWCELCGVSLTPALVMTPALGTQHFDLKTSLCFFSTRGLNSGSVPRSREKGYAARRQRFGTRVEQSSQTAPVGDKGRFMALEDGYASCS